MLLPRRIPLALALATALALAASAAPSNLHLRVDPFGYRPRASKVAIVRSPAFGYDSPAAYPAPAVLEIRRTLDQSLAYAGPPSVWKAGAIHGASGDRAWWFDFSALQETGSFYVRDPATGAQSEAFAIDPNVFDPVLKAAARMYYHQRCGAAKAVPYTAAGWSDGACHLHAQQDLDCRLVTNPVPATARDLSGGWHDAGDYNKYVNFADDAVHELLAAYELDPTAWPDDYGLPESGNGVPDLLDEIGVELRWFLKMQEDDGSVLHKVSVVDFAAASPPSADLAFRRYAKATASATISGCGAFARGALAYGALPDAASQAFASELSSAALAAWSWLEAHPGQIPSSYDNAGFQNAAAEDGAYEQEMNRLRAALHLFRLTGLATYRTWFDGHFGAAHLFQWTWASPWEQDVQETLLAYAATLGATLGVAQQIRSAYAARMKGADHLGQVAAGNDAYRAFLFDGDHTWGSNRTKCRQGAMYAAMNRNGIDPANAAAYRAAAEDYLHYVHGVNPTGFCYLTNLGALGAEQSVAETYHAWFAPGTPWDSAATSSFGPAPGYVTGGPNPSYAPDPSYSGPLLAPPLSQPILKSYKDWNTGWPEDSWEVTECHIPYQSAYLRLAAEFAIGAPAELSLDVSPSFAAGSTATFTVGGADPGSFVAILWSTAAGTFAAVDPAWTVDLDLALLPNPFAHLLFTGVASGAGMASWSAPVPAGLSGLTFRFQATQAGTTPWPVQSAVAVRGG